MQTIIKDDLDIENFMIDDYFNKYDEIKNVIFIDKDINLKLIQKFIEKNIDIHQKGEQLLIINCNIGDLDVVKLLIEKGADIHVKDDLAFIDSCYNGQIEIVNLLIEKGANIHAQNDLAFINSCFNGQIELVKLLINKSIQRQNDINDVCMICRNNEHQLIKLNCLHVICVNCLIEWVKTIKQLICPYCQQKINFDEKN